MQNSAQTHANAPQLAPENEPDTNATSTTNAAPIHQSLKESFVASKNRSKPAIASAVSSAPKPSAPAHTPQPQPAVVFPAGRGPLIITSDMAAELASAFNTTSSVAASMSESQATQPWYAPLADTAINQSSSIQVDMAKMNGRRSFGNSNPKVDRVKQSMKANMTGEPLPMPQANDLQIDLSQSPANNQSVQTPQFQAAFAGLRGKKAMEAHSQTMSGSQSNSKRRQSAPMRRSSNSKSHKRSRDSSGSQKQKLSQSQSQSHKRQKR